MVGHTIKVGFKKKDNNIGYRLQRVLNHMTLDAKVGYDK